MSSGAAETATTDDDESPAPAGTGTGDGRRLPVGVGWSGKFPKLGVQPKIGWGSGDAENGIVGAEDISEGNGERILARNSKFENLFKSAGKHKFKFVRSLNRMFLTLTLTLTLTDF